MKILVTVDIRKAFDSVPHPSILASAAGAGITGKPWAYIRGFLCDREFQVAVGQTLSAPKKSRVGVPQGAVLSPLLFNLVMAPLCYRLADIPGFRFSVYADDVTIWTNGGSDGDQSDAIQTGLDTIATFLKEVGLTPSSDKTNFVILGTKGARSASQFSFTFDGEQITQQDSVRVLGIYIDADGGAATWLRNITRTSGIRYCT